MAPSPPDPHQNHLLAALPKSDYERLEPHLEVIPMKLGDVLYESGSKLRYVYFPTTSIVSLLYVMEDGASAEIAIVGNEGILGISLFMGGDTTPSRAIVQSAGHGVRLKAELLKNEFGRFGPAMHLLLRYTQALITQMAQTAVCNRHHTVDQQLCRWLLLSLDRLESNELTMTQELIANMLGVRREGVTEAARKLQDAALIRYRRGRITVLDRPGSRGALLRVLPGGQEGVRSPAAVRQRNPQPTRAHRDPRGALCGTAHGRRKRTAVSSPRMRCRSSVRVDGIRARNRSRFSWREPRPAPSRGVTLVPSKQRAPPGNSLLETLPAGDRRPFLAGCETIEITFGDVLYEAGARLTHVFFPIRGFISLIMPVDTKSSLEVGLVGSNGMFGIPLALGVDVSPVRAVVQGSGSALRMDARALPPRAQGLGRRWNAGWIAMRSSSWSNSRRRRPARASTWSRRASPAGC